MKILSKPILIIFTFFVVISCGGGGGGDGDSEGSNNSQSSNTNINYEEWSCEFPASLPTMLQGSDNYILLETREMNERELDLWFHTSDCLKAKNLIREEISECVEMPQIAFVDGLNPNDRFTCSKNDRAKGCHRRDVVMVEESIADKDDVYIHEFCHRFCGVELKDRTHYNDCYVFDEEVYDRTGLETWDCVCEYEILDKQKLLENI